MDPRAQIRHRLYEDARSVPRFFKDGIVAIEPDYNPAARNSCLLVARSRLCQDHKHEASFSGLFFSDGFDSAEHAAADRTVG
jgi:hypothetical protein